MDTVWVVKQYQPDEGFNGEPVYIYTDEDTAIQCARNLNKTYSTGCTLTVDGDLDETLDENCYHYYDIEHMKLNEELPEVPNETCVIEVWDEGKDYSTSYVGNNKMKVEDINEAKQFKNWDEAMKYLHTLEALDVYEDKYLVINRF